jgi:hypothetical protein
VGFYFIDEGQRLQQQRKKVTQADVALRERTLQ